MPSETLDFEEPVAILLKEIEALRMMRMTPPDDDLHPNLAQLVVNCAQISTMFVRCHDRNWTLVAIRSAALRVRAMQLVRKRTGK
jgi:hypothetical protein